MSVARFLELVKSRFTPDAAKAKVSAFRAEPLAWKALSDDTLFSAFQDFAGQDSRLWQPGVFALFALSPKLAAQDLRDPEVKVPAAINTKALKTLETIRLTGLEPSTLEEAGLMALTLRSSTSKRQTGTTFTPS